MKKFSLSALLAGTSIAAIGCGVAWLTQPPDNVQQQAVAASVHTTSSATGRPAGMNQFASLWTGNGNEQPISANTASLESLWSKATALPNSNQPDTASDAEDQLRKLALSDPSSLHSLIQRYDGERNQHAKDVLKSILSTIQTPEVLAFSKQLATSRDAAQRQFGLELLQNLSSDSADVRNVLKQTLATEQTPALLVQALAALKPAVTNVSESDAIIAQLRGLTQNADATVRSQSILQLAQWDKKGDGLDRMSQALNDQVPEVRQAAIFAIAQTGVRSDDMKAALMAVIGSSSENRLIKGSALQVLERFSLNKEELATASQVRAQLQGL